VPPAQHGGMLDQPDSVLVTSAGMADCGKGLRRNSERNVSPSICGMLMSTIKRSGAVSSNFSSASTPFMASSIS
jgi:hypothetical protein